MRAIGLLFVFAALSAGCGAMEQASERPAEPSSLSAYGLSIRLPQGWKGRILLGASGRPVLHAASFSLPSNDDDSGEIAKESMGHGIYLNVRDLGPGEAGGELPVTFSASDFARQTQGWRLFRASREVAVAGDRYQVTAIAGDEGPPPEDVARANEVLGTLSIKRDDLSPLPALPDDAQRIAGHGVAMRLPPGWTGRSGRGLLEASSSEMHLTLREHAATEGSFVTGVPPIRLSTAEFVPPSEGIDPRIPAITGRSFVEHGREFLLEVIASSFPPSADTVEQANEALATLTVEPGDFYPGSVEPARFASADGWHTGTSGPAAVEPDGQQTSTWASTIPYRDEPFQSPPSHTLERLPPDGIVINVQLFGPERPGGGRAEPPFRIAQAEREYPWEGQVRDIPAYGIGGHLPGQDYSVRVTVFFGRNHPTADEIAAAEAELARLTFPDWTATD